MLTIYMTLENYKKMLQGHVFEAFLNDSATKVHSVYNQCLTISVHPLELETITPDSLEKITSKMIASDSFSFRIRSIDGMVNR